HHVGEGEIRILRGHALPDRRQRRSSTGGAHGEIGGAPRLLCAWHTNLQTRVSVELALADVGENAHHLALRRGAEVHPHRNSFTDWILARPDTPRERLVDDCHERRASAI